MKQRTRKRWACMQITLTATLILSRITLAVPQKETNDSSSNQNVIVVTATPLKERLSEGSDSIQVISHEDIVLANKPAVSQIIEPVPGLQVLQGNLPSQPVSVFMRGMEGRHLLVLIDGIEANDPISPTRTFSFAHMRTHNIEEIKILRGPHSTLYGSDAMAGVIHLETKKPEASSADYSIELGAFDTIQHRAHLFATGSRANLSCGVLYESSDGFSATQHPHHHDEPDGYQNITVSSRLELSPSDISDLVFHLRYSDTKTDLDQTGLVINDDPNYEGRARQLFLAGKGSLLLLDDLWEQGLMLSHMQSKRTNEDGPDAIHGEKLLHDSYEGQTTKLQWNHTLYWHDAATITAGAEYEDQYGKSSYYSLDPLFGEISEQFPEKRLSSKAVYLQNALQKDMDNRRIIAVAGLRYDDQDMSGSDTTYRISSAHIWNRTSTKLRASLGTAFKAPTLYQLFSSFGNLSLEAEHSRGWDIGIEQLLYNKQLNLSLTYFNNTIDDLISFDVHTSTYDNTEQAKTEGLEISTAWRPNKNIRLQAGYTYTDSKDLSTGKALLRRARHTFALSLIATIAKKTQALLEVLYTGKRRDQMFTPIGVTDVTPGGYTVVNVSVQYEVNKHLQIFGRIDNLLDRTYESIKGFPNHGFAIYGGVRIKI